MDKDERGKGWLETAVSGGAGFYPRIFAPKLQFFLLSVQHFSSGYNPIVLARNRRFCMDVPNMQFNQYKTGAGIPCSTDCAVHSLDRFDSLGTENVGRTIQYHMIRYLIYVDSNVPTESYAFDSLGTDFFSRFICNNSAGTGYPGTGTR